MSGAIYWGSIGARSTILTWSVSENRHKVSQVLSAKVPVLISFKIPERRKKKGKYEEIDHPKRFHRTLKLIDTKIFGSE